MILIRIQSWDDELEFSSLRNALSCKMEHDGCRKTEKYLVAGQNLAMVASKPDFTPVEKVIQQSVQMWYAEYKDVLDLKEVDKLGSSHSKWNLIGHWTQFVQSKAHRIGCSVVEFTDRDGWKRTLVGCNYRLLLFIIGSY